MNAKILNLALSRYFILNPISLWGIKKLLIMKQFGISVSTMMIRFYMMVIIVIIAGFLGQWWLSLVGGAVFMSSLLGLVWKGKQK